MSPSEEARPARPGRDAGKGAGRRQAGQDPGSRRARGQDPGSRRARGQDPGSRRARGQDPGSRRAAAASPRSRGAAGSSTRRQRGAGAADRVASAARGRGAPPARGRAEPARRQGAAGEGGDGGLLRLNKALSGAGLGSRRAVEELVRAGRVSVDGEVVQDLGRRVDPARDRVAVDGSRVVLDERRRYWLLNKPAGVITTAADPSGRPTVVGLVPDQPRVFPVGRLDRDTEGLLLLTNDGPLAYRLTHARYGVEKRYLAEVERLPAAAPARLRQGVELEDGPARPVRVRVVAGSGRRRMVEVGLVEGRNREVRRLLDAVGAPVRRLVRTAVGPIRLTGLAPGEFRALRPDEVRSLYQAVGL